MRGAAVAWISNRLAALAGAAAVAAEDAVFDAALKDRVIAFQRARGLDPDGLVGPRTLIALNTVSDDPAIPTLVVRNP